MGCGRVCWWPGICRWELGSGDVATEGPFGVDVRDRRRAGVDRDAALASALARSGSCMRVVRSDLREVRFGRESTRWKSPSPFTDDGPDCASSESSQSDESSSSSMALSETPSSSSSSEPNTELYCAGRATATSSLNEAFFLLPVLVRLPDCRRLSDRLLRCM